MEKFAKSKLHSSVTTLHKLNFNSNNLKNVYFKCKIINIIIFYRKNMCQKVTLTLNFSSSH